MIQKRDLVLFQVGSIKYLKEIKIGRPRLKADVSLRTRKTQKWALADLAGSFTSTSGKINREQKGGTLSSVNLRFLMYTDSCGGVLILSYFSVQFFSGSNPKKLFGGATYRTFLMLPLFLIFTEVFITILTFGFFSPLISYMRDVWNGWCPWRFLL